MDVAVDAQGNAVAVWRRHVSGLAWSIMAATRPVGGQWSAPTELAPADTFAALPDVAVDPDGNAVAIWEGKGGPGRTVIFAVSRPVGGSWSEPVAISDGGSDDGHDLVVDAQGTATAIWSQHDAEEEGWIVWAATRPRGGAWSEPVRLSERGVTASQAPQLAVDGEGNVTAVWTLHRDGSDGRVVQTKRRPAGGAWSAEAVDLSSEEGFASHPVVAAGPDGSATVAWTFYEPGGSGGVVQSRHRAPDGAWSPETTDHSGDGERASGPVVAVDPQGNATVVWSAFAADGHVVRSSSRPAGGEWSAPVDIAAPDGGVDPVYGAPDPRVVVDPQGNVIVAWRSFARRNTSPLPVLGDYYRLRAATRPRDGAWSAPIDLSPVGEDIQSPDLAVDPHGYATALWIEPLGVSAIFSDNVVRSRVFDPVAPVLTDVAVPSRGVVGVPVPMSVDPFDVWSAVTTSWDFGDGRSGSGAAVEHCFRAPGEHTVTVTGTDGAGNATSVARTIAIESNPALDPGADPCPGPDDEPGGDPGDRQGGGAGHGGGSNAGAGSGAGSGGGTGSTSGAGRSRAPVVSRLWQSSARWRARSAGRRPGLPVGTIFRFHLDRPATVRLAFAAIAKGRRVGGRCVKPNAANRARPHCRREVPRGTVTLTGRAGRNAYTFKGRLRGRTLPPGRYRLRVTASANGVRSAPAVASFTIMR